MKQIVCCVILCVILRVANANIPYNSHKILTHNERKFDVYVSNDGKDVYVVPFGNNEGTKIAGISGPVTAGNLGVYSIYFTVTLDSYTYRYYALAYGESEAARIKGLPDDAKLLSVHNLARLLVFSSVCGGYELRQGEMVAFKKGGRVVDLAVCKVKVESDVVEGGLKEALASERNKCEREMYAVRLGDIRRIRVQFNGMSEDKFTAVIDKLIRKLQDDLNALGIS